MLRLACFVLTAAVSAATIPGPLAAQQPSDRVSTVVESADELYRQLDYAMNLTTPQEQGQTKNLKEHFDVFLIGVSRQQPGRMDLVIDQRPFRYQLAVPVQDLPNFRANNLVPLGLDNRQIARTLYRFHNKVWNGFMRFDPATSYATFGELAADVPPTLPDPRLAIQPVLKRGYDAAFDLETDNPAPAAQQQRRDFFNQPQGVRDTMLSALVQGQNETADQFALRKLTVEHQLDELERLYAEATQAQLGWTLDPQQQQGRFELAVTPIPETELANMVAALGEESSRFAGIPRSEAPVLSARINHPLDAMRQDNFRETWTMLANIAKKDIAADNERNADQKKASNTLVDRIFDLLDANLRAGLAEGFAEVWPEGERHTGVAAMRSTDGTKAADIIQDLPATRTGRQAQLDVDKHGDVRIHEIQITEADHPGYREFFGDNKLYVGSSPEVVWFAAGPRAIEALKTAIDQAGQPAGDRPIEPAVQMFVRLRPWVELIHKRIGMGGDPQREKWRRLALEAFEPGDDVIELTINRKEANLGGQMIVQPGLLRYIGKMFADFSRENLAN